MQHKIIFNSNRGRAPHFLPYVGFQAVFLPPSSEGIMKGVIGSNLGGESKRGNPHANDAVTLDSIATSSKLEIFLESVKALKPKAGQPPWYGQQPPIGCVVDISDLTKIELNVLNVLLGLLKEKWPDELYPKLLLKAHKCTPYFWDCNDIIFKLANQHGLLGDGLVRSGHFYHPSYSGGIHSLIGSVKLKPSYG